MASLALWAIMPRGVIVFNDDFGYVRSVVETVARSRPWTNDWLEPWSASLSIMSAVIFKTTGSFRLATQGLQSLLWGATAAGLIWCLAQRQYSRWSAVLLTFSLCLIPTLLWKGIEFSALVIYIPCVVFAIGAASRDRWAMFAIFSCIALASRQSAIAWFAIPLASLGRDLHLPDHARPRQIWKPLLACVAGGMTWLTCQLLMNQTHAQRVMTTGMWESLQLASFIRRFEFALLLVLICLGAANSLIWLARKSSIGWKGYSKTEFIWRGVVPVLTTIVLLIFGRIDVQREHDLYDGTAGMFHVVSWIVIAFFGWLVAPFKIDIRLLSGALVSAALASLRIATWDYYWIDAALFAFFSVLGPQADGERMHLDTLSAAKRGHQFRSAVAFCVFALLLIPAIAWVDRAKKIMDDCRAKEVILEQSLRQREILPSELSAAPFGFMGWHLFPYFITTPEGKNDYIANFQNYLREGCLIWETRSASNSDPLPNPETVVRTGVFPIGWKSEKHQFILRRQKQFSAASVEIDSGRYNFVPFPLNDAEWRQQCE